MYILFAVLSAITAALVAIFGKLGLRTLDPTLATTIRGVIMGVFLVLFSLALGLTGRLQWAHLSGREWLWIVLAAVAGAASWTFYFIALKMGTASAVAALDRTSIVFTIILAALVLGETITWKVGLGAALMAVGAMLIVLR